MMWRQVNILEIVPWSLPLDFFSFNISLPTEHLEHTEFESGEPKAHNTHLNTVFLRPAAAALVVILAGVVTDPLFHYPDYKEVCTRRCVSRTARRAAISLLTLISPTRGGFSENWS